jgi:hypothetical protein
VPQRRLTAVTLALVATAALAAACEIDVKPGSIPAPFSIAPVPSASADQPKYVCTAVYKILTDGAVRLAEFATGSTDEAKQGMRDTFADMATETTAAGVKSTDPVLRERIDKIAEQLNAGSRETDPKAYLNGGFTTVGQNLDGACD